jgi:hypothetical protein
MRTFYIRDVPILHDRFWGFSNRYTLAAFCAVDSDVPLSRFDVLGGRSVEAKHGGASFLFVTPLAIEGMAYRGYRIVRF